MNAIKVLLANPFLSRHPEEQLKIRELGRPTPYLNSSKTLNFNVEIYSNNDWICGCDVDNALYCFPCVVFGGGGLWATTGYKDSIDISSAITTHELDTSHIHNVINYSLIGKKSTNGGKKAGERHNIEVQRNLQVLDLLIRTITFCGKGYIPIVKRTYDQDDEDYYMMDVDAFHELLELVPGFNNTLKNYLKMDIFRNDLETMKNDIVNSAFEVYQAEVLKEIHRTEFLSIIIDLNDYNEEYSKVFILRYVVDGKPVERIWKLMKHENDDSFFETLKKDLELIVNDRMKLISQSHQQLNFKMSGIANSLNLKLQSIYPNAELVHFYHHGLADIIINSMDFDMQVRIFFCHIWNICAFFTEEIGAKQQLKVFEKIVNSKPNDKKKWDFMKDRVNTVYNYKNELLETMDTIQDETLNFPYVIISKASNLRLHLGDDDFEYWLRTFYLIIPQIESYLNEYESCLKLLDPEFSFILESENIHKILNGEVHAPIPFSNPPEVEVKIEEDLEIFQSNMEDLKMEIETTQSELLRKASISTVSNISRKRKLIDSKRELEVDMINSLMLQLQERLKFRGHMFASRLVQPTNFQQYKSDFPESFFEITVKCFPTLNSIRLRSELEVLYERLEYQALEGSSSLLKDILESKLQSTFQQTVRLLNIVLTIPTKVNDPDRCFSTQNEVKFYLKNCRDPEFIEYLLPLACEKEFIDNIFDFNKKVVQIFAEKPGRAVHFKRQTLTEKD